jgi:hypothetical protein
MKRVEQVAKDGSVVIDYDDPVVREKVDALFERLFPGEVIRDEKQIVISGNVGPLGFIVGMIIGLVGAACIGTLVAMIVFGFLGKGFAVGWKIHADFSWEWFCGSLD